MAADATLRQAERLLQMRSSLGPDALVPTGFRCAESLSGLYACRVEFLSRDHGLAPDGLLGKTAAVGVGKPGPRRWFHGRFRSVQAGDLVAHGYRAYVGELVPDLWRLTLNTDCRIHHEKSALDIVRSVLERHGVTEAEFGGVSGARRKRDFTVQYRESDFDFISRLLEDEGVFYYFVHSESGHRLVFGDKVSAYRDSGLPPVPLRRNRDVVQHIADWQPAFASHAGRHTHRDYNWQAAAFVEAGEAARARPGIRPEPERYDYPAGFTDVGTGRQQAKLKVERDEATYAVARGGGDCHAFSPGATFTMGQNEVEGEAGKKHLLTCVEHVASEAALLSGAGGASYSNSFACIPAETLYRPPWVTPRPVVGGPQTATVVGPGGDEIFMDDKRNGQVRVQFHWDRLGQNDQRSSCWIRVAHAIAGDGWGMQFTPRVGQEVVVAFLEGDPDRPLVVGSVYNGTHPPPYADPGRPAVNGYRSRSSKGGGAANYNELAFDDTKGEELVRVRAERDYERTVVRDDKDKVGRDQAVEVQRHRAVTIKAGNDGLTIESGNQTTKVAKGKALHEAMQEIQLKVGQSSITLTPSGITIKALQVRIEATTSVEVKGVVTKVEGSATVVVKGGIVMVN